MDIEAPWLTSRTLLLTQNEFAILTEKSLLFPGAYDVWRIWKLL